MIVKRFPISVSAVYGILMAGVVLRIFPATVFAGLLTIPLALRIRRVIQNNIGNPYGLMPAMSMNVKLFTYTSTLILIGYIASFFLH